MQERVVKLEPASGRCEKRCTSRTAPTGERGVYRSEDGGESWEKILYVDENSGASDLSMDMTNPRILYASFWDHRRPPWRVVSGGAGSGFCKSMDGGDSWEPINDGMPEPMGKTAIDVAFSCKGRGACPSCNAKLMAQTAAHLVDHVIPHVPVRQWVPKPLPPISGNPPHPPFLTRPVRLTLISPTASGPRRALLFPILYPS